MPSCPLALRCDGSIAVCGCLPATGATAQWYVGVGIGGNASRDVVMESRSNDRASICDQYINPRALSVAGSTTADRGAGDGWLAPFDPGAGFSREAEFGLRPSPRWRLAAVYARSGTDFDQTVSSTDATGADFDKIGNELSVGEETLGSATFRRIPCRRVPRLAEPLPVDALRGRGRGRLAHAQGLPRARARTSRGCEQGAPTPRT